MQSQSSTNPQQGSVLSYVNFPTVEGSSLAPRTVITPPAAEGSSIAPHIVLTPTRSHDSLVVMHEGHDASHELGSTDTTHREGSLMESPPGIGSTFSPLKVGPSTCLYASFPTSSISLDCGNCGNEAPDVLDSAISGNAGVNSQCDMHVFIGNEQQSYSSVNCQTNGVFGK
ncbi:hypothetical protein V6N13_065853 [Hibiscus sabdariffa]|uniref:Uncharacterized protein n=1 Tax=Hibiscus sabdariffa TaxID=183260 RepID=A0ABR2BHU0_9ROSI